jgi:hypothetical protein
MKNFKTLPKWLKENDLIFYADQFLSSGMRGPLNRYRCIDFDWKELNHLSNKKISRPSCFITGDLDPVNYMVLNGFRSSGQKSPMTSYLKITSIKIFCL